jgi:hypothetical protein
LEHHNPNNRLKIDVQFVDDNHAFVGNVQSMIVSDSQEFELRLRESQLEDEHSIQIPVWTVSNPQVYGLETSADGIVCYLKPTGKLGSCKVFVLAQIGNGYQIAGSLHIEVRAGQAVSLGVGLGKPQQQ